MNKLDIMLDLETLSLKPTAAIIQIAAIPFDKREKTLSGNVPKPFNKQFVVNVDATTCAMFGLSFDKETLDWWANQSLEAKNCFFKGGVSLTNALCSLNENINEWLDDAYADEAIIWSEGTDFDAVIIRNAYRVVGELMPWKYNSVRDVRTYVNEIERLLNVTIDVPMRGIAHNSIDDCKHQIARVQKATEILLNKINKGNERIEFK